MIRGLSHVCFRVGDLDAAVDFYVNVLGLSHAFDFTRETGERYGAYLYLGSRTFIELFARPRDKEAPTGSHSFQHICLEVDSMAETVAHLRSRGAEVSDPKTGMDGNPQAWLSDPDGNRIELHELRPDGWQLAALRRIEGAG